MEIALTEAQFEALQTYLASIAPNSRERGLKYFREGRVTDLESNGYDLILAIVQGSEPYEVALCWEDKKCLGRCDCPMEVNCKHCYATGLALQAGQPTQEPSAVIEETAKGTADTFAALIKQRLDRKLTAKESATAKAVDSFYKNHRHSKFVNEGLIAKITRQGHSWGWQTFQIWPSEPRSAWEAWLYLVAHFRRNKIAEPASFIAATDPAEVDAFIAAWQRSENISRWRDWLQTSTQKNDTAAPSLAELRVKILPAGPQLEWRKKTTDPFAPMKQSPYNDLVNSGKYGALPLHAESLPVWRLYNTGYGGKPFLKYGEPVATEALNQLLRLPGFEKQIVGNDDKPLRRETDSLVWKVDPAASDDSDYRLTLTLPDGSAPPPALAIIDGTPPLYLTADSVFSTPPIASLQPHLEPIKIPAEVLETNEGLTLLDRLQIPLPPRMENRIQTVQLHPVLRCGLSAESDREQFQLTARAEEQPGNIRETFTREGWQKVSPSKTLNFPKDGLVRLDRSRLQEVAFCIDNIGVNWNPYTSTWHRTIAKTFPTQFADWLASIPPEITLELDPLLASLREAPLTATVKLDVAEAGIDWFDLRVALDVADTTLTEAELRSLLDAKGGYVRLGERGWRRLEFALSAEDEQQLADLGLSARDFSSEPQRLHALQLAGKKAATRLLPPEQALAITRRAAEIQTRVAPALPTALQGELRPYQIEGFHFLAYLSTNHFGGILADDMGLGKTIQTLTWLLWLREQPGFTPQPSLVVCPKSVTENWIAEVARFAPSLRVTLLRRSSDLAVVQKACAESDLVVANYAQLRHYDTILTGVPWHSVILDEAQYIKNPASQTARVAFSLQAAHKLALSGTPIENRLLDLWSIMTFAMPGVLGPQARFAKAFDQKADPFARRRLTARVRPFVLRRTKNEVAKDLPDRIEEDLHCEMEGPQATLYQAELKKARVALLGIKTQSALNKERFNILTSLLRLRQICCHPVLVSDKSAKDESAKLSALLDLLEPLVEEGHKVLVFSQFVGMLELIQAELVARQWHHFLLTGQTEERGKMVKDFQATAGSAVFLISLRAGGFGLNLTAASYVVLYDPWWNPAVENQAIDRTHRIGQTSKVIAYRLIVKNSIEEKIRHLQKQKSALAEDVLGEENFTNALTLNDFQFLFAD